MSAWKTLLSNSLISAGRFFERRGKYRRASHLYALATQLDPTSYSAHVRLGHSARKRKAFATAERAFSVAAALKEDSEADIWSDEMRRLAKAEFASRAGSLRTKLWGGHSDRALRELEQLLEDRSQRRTERCHAAWALSQWYFCEGDFEKALKLAVAMREISPPSIKTLRQRCLEVDCLLALGRIGEAHTILRDLCAERPNDPHLLLRFADAVPGPKGPARDTARLRIVNQIFTSHDLAPLDKSRNEELLKVSNLLASAPQLPKQLEQPLVSIIVPSYCCASTIGIALDSLLTQTWKNLEIIVVDDCSTDETATVIEMFSRRDKRVKLLRQPTNKGAYAARNAGLSAANGKLITTHDADDWSHPQKIEKQALAITHSAECVASLSFWVRATKDLRFRGMIRPLPSMVQLNHSSFMVRRDVFDTVGAWDNVRIAADHEFIKRVGLHYGPSCIVNVLPLVPLSFGLYDTDSALTRSKQTHVLTIYHGVRRTYREAWRYWHQTAGRHASLDRLGARAPFPAPASILSDRQRRITVDQVVEGDFARDGDALLSRAQKIMTAGFSVGVRDVPIYESNVERPTPDKVWRHVHLYNMMIVAPGEPVVVVEGAAAQTAETESS